jgi:hypothetical protein
MALRLLVDVSFDPPPREDFGGGDQDVAAMT